MSQTPVSFPKTILGIDFSGAGSAGRKIWISEGRLETDGTCRIGRCIRAADLPGGGRDRDRALSALVRYIVSHSDAVAGLDFPFSLPAQLLAGESWETFIRAFPGRYPSADRFRLQCQEATGGKELKRRTDTDTKTPFSPYNIRLYRQTYHGLRDVLHPLVAGDHARILPMQEVAPGKATILEICPASTLQRSGMYLPYKGKGVSHRAARMMILHWMEGDTDEPTLWEISGARGPTMENAPIIVSDGSMREAMVDDPEGDALDSLIALVATLRAAKTGTFMPPAEHDSSWKSEGYVYV